MSAADAHPDPVGGSVDYDPSLIGVPMQPPLSAWPSFEGLETAPLAGGLINDSFVLGDPPAAVLQRLHPVFGPSVHEDIAAVTAHLDAAGMVTPRLIPTREGGLYALDHEGRCWRAMTWIPGVTRDQLDDPALAAAAGDLVGRWHAATADLRRDFVFTRPGAHDTENHMKVLRGAVDGHADHRLYDRVAVLAEHILGAWERWSGRLDGPVRVCHGDLKISNLRFDEEGHGVCLIDLDTMANLPLDVEMGDAFRSWCNPDGEDVEEARFHPELFVPAARAWLLACPQPAAEIEALVPGIQRICLELAARFAADALNESYFGWDASRFSGRGEHNLLRALGQSSLADSVAAQQLLLEDTLRRG